MENVKIFVKGLIVGFGKIMPGVSGSVLAIVLGVYEKLIASLSSLKEFRKNAKFMANLGLGIAISIVLGSNMIKYLLTNYYLKTIMFFIGMLIPGVFPLLKNVKNEDITLRRIITCTLIFVFLVVLNTVGFKSTEVVRETYLHEFISLVLCGLLDAASTIIPGISGTAILMILGYYEKIITALANILTFENMFQCLLVLVPFFIGMGVGVVLTSKLITYLFKTNRAFTYMMIIVFAMFSVVALFINVSSLGASASEFIGGSVFLLLGFTATTLLNKYMGSE